MSYHFLQFIILIAVCYALSYQIMLNLARVSKKYFLLRLILFPGVVVHELAHVLACVVTRTPVEDISFWDETGGSVTHHKPKYSFITQPIISFAPFPIGITLLIFLSQRLDNFHWWIAGIALFFMVSIAATLAPSKTDIVHAIEGSIFIFGVLIALYIVSPETVLEFAPHLGTFNQQMIIVDAILILMWIGLYFSHALIQSIRR